MLGERVATVVVVAFSGVLGGAGHRVAVHSAVQLDHRGLGRHGGVAVLR